MHQLLRDLHQDHHDLLRGRLLLSLQLLLPHRLLLRRGGLLQEGHRVLQEVSQHQGAVRRRLLLQHRHTLQIAGRITEGPGDLGKGSQAEGGAIWGGLEQGGRDQRDDGHHLHRTQRLQNCAELVLKSLQATLHLIQKRVILQRDGPDPLALRQAVPVHHPGAAEGEEAGHLHQPQDGHREREGVLGQRQVQAQEQREQRGAGEQEGGGDCEEGVGEDQDQGPAEVLVQPRPQRRLHLQARPLRTLPPLRAAAVTGEVHHPVRSHLHHRHLALLRKPQPRTLLRTRAGQPAPLRNDQTRGPQEDEERRELRILIICDLKMKIIGP